MNRKPIGLTIGRHMFNEANLAASSFGLPARIKKKMGLSEDKEDKGGD